MLVVDEAVANPARSLALVMSYSPLGSSGTNDGLLKLAGYAALDGKSRKACRYVDQVVVIVGVSDNIIQSDCCSFRLRHVLKESGV